MFDQFTQVAATLSDSPILQACLAAVSTLILEDPTTIGCGFLVAHGSMTYWAAFWGLFLGIAAGDFSLFMFGRFTASRLSKAGVTGGERLAMIGQWFKNNIVFAVLAARVAPGTRMPTYIAAGASGANAIAFLATTIVASLVWTVILLNLSIYFGEAVLSELGPYKVPLAIVIVGGFIGLQWYLAKRRSQKAKRKKVPAASYFEFWPSWIFYTPIALWAVFLGLRYRCLTLPTVVNPKIFSGGMIGEKKSDVFALASRTAAKMIAPWIHIQKTDDPNLIAQIEQDMKTRGIDFPVVAKPDIGQKGSGVRTVASEEQLREYVDVFPSDAVFLLQELIPYEYEANVLYYRIPGEENGHILSLSRKRFLVVRGDGQKTLQELIEADERAKRFKKALFRRFADSLSQVIPQGEIFKLTFVGNHIHGTQCRDSNNHITQAMTMAFDDIAKAIPELWFCRFVVRFETLSLFKQGKNFTIVDINGASSEVTHIWDPRTTLLGAYRDVFNQWKIIYTIGAKNRARGFKPMSVKALWKALQDYKQLEKKYPVVM